MTAAARLGAWAGPRLRALELLARLDATPRYVVVGVVILALANLVMVAHVIRDSTPTDWAHYVRVGQRLLAGEPVYNAGPGAAGFNYNPLLAYVFAFTPSWTVWALLHVAAAVAMPRPIGLVVLLSFPFWADVMVGNVLVFLLLPAAWALRGQGWAIAATFVLALLIPRPLMLPLVLWLLWRYPAWRLPFVGIVAAVGVATFATGMASDWLAVVGRATGDIGHYWNMSPSRFLGLAWIPIGVSLAAFLAWRGYVGLACLAASPYLLPYYLMFGLLDLRDGRDLAVAVRENG